jgi:hypothetical protein
MGAAITALASFSWVTLKSASALQEMSKLIQDTAPKLKLLSIDSPHAPDARA